MGDGRNQHAVIGDGLRLLRTVGSHHVIVSVLRSQSGGAPRL